MCGEQLQAIEKFIYLCSYVSSDVGMSDKINLKIMKARLAYAELDYL